MKVSWYVKGDTIGKNTSLYKGIQIKCKCKFLLG